MFCLQAFDTIDNKIFLSQLDEAGITGLLNDVRASFFSDKNM